MQESLLISPDTEATVNAPLPYTDPVTARTASAAMNGLSPQGLAASPEQVRGLPATAASDLWSLGATLFTAVEGHPPFPRRHEREAQAARPAR